MYSRMFASKKKINDNASTLFAPMSVHYVYLNLFVLLGCKLLINQSRANNNNNLRCQFHSINFCHACKQNTHLKASVGNEGELQSLVGLLDTVSENERQTCFNT